MLRPIHGQVVELYYIGALAEALGKSPFTIRRWERDKVLPRPPFGKRLANGTVRRLYPREFIEGLVVIAEEERVAFGKPYELATTHFTERAFELRRRLYEPVR